MKICKNNLTKRATEVFALLANRLEHHTKRSKTVDWKDDRTFVQVHHHRVSTFIMAEMLRGFTPHLHHYI